MKEKRGFTLIELLMTMAIIAILAGFILSGVNIVWNTAIKRACKAQVSTLFLAVKQYEADYGLPDTSDYSVLIQCLAGKSPRGVTYLPLQNNGVYLDRWHNQFRVKTTTEKSMTLGTDTIYSNIAVWSCGFNKKDDQGGGDDITSWK